MKTVLFSATLLTALGAYDHRPKGGLIGAGFGHNRPFANLVYGLDPVSLFASIVGSSSTCGVGDGSRHLCGAKALLAPHARGCELDQGL